MDISDNPAKDARNVKERGLSFARVAAIDFQSSALAVDARRDYGPLKHGVNPGCLLAH